MFISERTVKVLADIVTGDSKRSPYRSGPDLVALFNDLGASDVYGRDFPSRRSYALDKIMALLGSPELEQLITMVLDDRDFYGAGLSIEKCADHLNFYLKFDGYELVKDGVYYRVAPINGGQSRGPETNVGSVAERVSEALREAPHPGQDPRSSSRVFIVHGHDEAMKEATARFLMKLGLDPIILHEQVSAGKTIMEKFEHFSDVPYAVVLLSPDDVGAPRQPAGQVPQVEPRARQNVIFELGYVIGKLSRSHVCALKKGEVEQPSDVNGVVYVDFDNAGGWQIKLARELKAAGVDVDASGIL